MSKRDLGEFREERATSGRRTLGWVVLAGLLAALPLPLSGGSGPISAAAQSCQTPFLVYTDPDNPGVSADTGAFRMTTDSGLLGEYTGDGHFAGYSIDGTQDAIVNTATGMAQVRGAFTATSPDGGSSFDVLYTGRVDFGAGMATGYFTASGGAGNDAGYSASGTIEGAVVGPATLDGADVGLC
jgi:hypothetical protein